MRRDLVAFITSAFALAFRRPYFLELCANAIETPTAKKARSLLPLVARKQCDSEGAFVTAHVVGLVLTDPMPNSDSSGVDKGVAGDLCRLLKLLSQSDLSKKGRGSPQNLSPAASS